MINTEIKTIDGNEYKYTYSTLSVYIMNEDGQKYEYAYDAIDSNHTYTETEEPIECDDGEEREWLHFIKEYQMTFGDTEYIYSKYKLVRKCIEIDIWNKFKVKMEQSEMKDLFDAAIEFSSKDDMFIKGAYFGYKYFSRDIHQLKEFLDCCIKD